MIIIATLVVLFVLFFFLRKNIGVALLATIAGISVHQMFGKYLIDFIAHNFENPDVTLISNCVYLVFVFLVPMVLYFRTAHGGLFGVLRIAEAAIFAALLASLCSSQISYICSWDEVSLNIMNFIEGVKGWILIGGVGAAYFDILTCREI